MEKTICNQEGFLRILRNLEFYSSNWIDEIKKEYTDKIRQLIDLRRTLSITLGISKDLLDAYDLNIQNLNVRISKAKDIIEISYSIVSKSKNTQDETIRKCTSDVTDKISNAFPYRKGLKTDILVNHGSISGKAHANMHIMMYLTGDKESEKEYIML